MEENKNNILVIDEDPVIADVTKRLLDMIGYEAEAACSTKDVITKLNNHCYEWILLDFQMTEMDTEGMIYDIRKDCPDQKIILTSASVELIDLEALCKRIIPNPVILRKPFSMVDLITILEENNNLDLISTNHELNTVG